MAESQQHLGESDMPSTSSSLCNAGYFSTLAKIVDHMKKRYFDNPSMELSLDEILAEIHAYDTSKKCKQWLQENLPSNPRIHVGNNGKFKFKPPYKIKGKTSLIKLLKKRHENGNGGVLLSDLAECIPLPEKVLESLGKEAAIIDTKWNGKQDKAVFWNDSSTDLEVDEDIEIDAPIPAKIPGKEDKGKTRKTKGIMKYEHMSETLEDYGSTS